MTSHKFSLDCQRAIEAISGTDLRNVGRPVYLACASLFLLLACASASLALECPGPNKVPHRDGSYTFTYESWIKRQPNRDHYDFGRCVENKKTDAEMFVDWKKTGVKGFAKPPENIVDSGVDSPSDAFDMLDTTLWYGAKPEPLTPAPYREVRKVAGKFQQPSLRSWIRMAVPTDAAAAVKTLVFINVEFFSYAFPLANGNVVYHYAWVDHVAGTRAPIAFRSSSASLERASKATDTPSPLQLRSTQGGVFLIDRAGPDYATVILEFLDRSGKPVASAPVAIYHPTGSMP